MVGTSGGVVLPRSTRAMGKGGFRSEQRDNPSFSSRQSFITATTQTHSQPHELNFDQQLQVSSSFIPGDCIFVPSRPHGILLSLYLSSTSLLPLSSSFCFRRLISSSSSISRIYLSSSAVTYISIDVVVCSTENRVCSRSYREPSKAQGYSRFRIRKPDIRNRYQVTRKSENLS